MCIDLLLKLNTIEELLNGINKDNANLNAIKNQLNTDQEECCKLYHKIKISANLLDEVVKEKKKIQVENETLVIYIVYILIIKSYKFIFV